MNTKNFFLLLSILFVAGISLPFNHLGCMDQPALQEPDNKELSYDEKIELLNKLYNKLDSLFEDNEQKYNKDSGRGVRDNFFQNRFIFPPIIFNPEVDAEENKNKVQEICNFIFEIPQLNSLYLRNLKLDEVPRGIKKMTDVKIIDISNNNIRTIPGNEIRSLNFLDQIDLSNNPVVEQSSDPVNWGIQEILENGFYIPDPQKSLVFKSKKSYVRKAYNSSGLLDTYVRFFFSDVPGSGAQQNTVPSIKSLKEMASSIIFNEDGIEDKMVDYKKSTRLYDTLKSDPELFKKGNSLTIPAGQYEIPSSLVSGEKLILKVDQDLPVGYQIYLPKDSNNITAVYVEVYGGNSRLEVMNLESPAPNYAYFLSHGVAVVMLNLLDLYDLTVGQAEMPLELHGKLHLSIDYFFETLKNNPELLGVEKKQLLGKKIVLEGASFGGRTAVRHSELYPGTFDGYISHDGSLDYTGLDSMQAKAMRKTEHFEKWIDPSGQNWVEAIKDPILLLQNFDDNNVAVKVATSFYKRARQAHKDVQLLVSPQGQPMEQGWEARNKGHYIPTDQRVFKRYMDTILHFILFGTSELAVMSDWQADKYDIYANNYLNQNYETLSLNDKFIAWALRVGNYKRAEDYGKRVIKTYEGKNIPEKVKPLLAPTHHESWKMFSNPEITNQTIYDALAYLEEHKDVVPNSNQLTDEAIRNMLLYHLPLFVDYLFENNGEVLKIFSREDLFRETMADKNTIPVYRNMLMNRSIDSLSRYYLLRILYIANPTLLDSFREEKASDQLYQRAKEKALKEFDNLAQKMKEYPKKAWKAAIGGVQRMEQFKKESADSLMNEYRKRKQEQKNIG